MTDAAKTVSKAENDYTITVFTENIPGLLSEVVSVFTRIKLNIESLTVSASTVEGIHRFTVATHCTEKVVKKLVGQLEKKVDVVAAFFYTEDETVAREMGMYKVSPTVLSDEAFKERMMESFNPYILEQTEDYVVLICTGSEKKIIGFHEMLKEKVKEKGVSEFVRSGRVAVVKQMDPFTKRLEDMSNHFY